MKRTRQQSSPVCLGDEMQDRIIALANALAIAKRARGSEHWLKVVDANYKLLEQLAGGLPFTKREMLAFVERGMRDVRVRGAAVR